MAGEGEDGAIASARGSAHALFAFLYICIWPFLTPQARVGISPASGYFGALSRDRCVSALGSIWARAPRDNSRVLEVGWEKK